MNHSEATFFRLRKKTFSKKNPQNLQPYKYDIEFPSNLFIVVHQNWEFNFALLKKKMRVCDLSTEKT